MTSLYTPGPWTYVNRDHNHAWWNIESDAGTIAHVLYVDSPVDQPAPVSIALANARLITAAPDLLVVARAAIMVCSRTMPNTAAMLRDAVAKATGEDAVR